MQFFQFFTDIFLVFLIGDAEPDSIRGKNFNLQITVMHEVIHEGGQEAFLLEGIAGLILQEAVQVFDSFFKEIRRKAPEVHGYERVGIEDDAFGIVMNIPDGSIREGKDVEGLSHLNELSVFRGADAAGHMAVL